MKIRLCIAIGTLALLPLAAATFGAEGGPSATPEQIEFFEKKVRPLLVERCQECHGGKGKPKGGLSLLSAETLLKGGDSGPAAVAGKPEDSLLIDVLNYVDEPRMPPDGKLKAEEIEILREWVELGLPWPNPAANPASQHATEAASEKPADASSFWSFLPVGKYEPPKVKDFSWVRNDIDRFILAGIEAKGGKPAREASKRTLIRRATFDLTGLPPTPEEVEAFLADEGSDAFSKVVERLLASPHYGERWGRHWLDVVRYADSFDSRILGSVEADIAYAYRYRDWVVNAFNRDLPYDQFIVHQLAGDILPVKKPGGFNVDETIATGMLAIGNWGGGDADKEKLLTDIADDQVDVVGRTFLGLTLACARCHDHKFDPITTKDYYGLAGIFFSTHILPNVGLKTNGPPMLRIPLMSASEMEHREHYTKRSVELENELNRVLNEEKAAFAKVLLSDSARYIVAAWEARKAASATSLAEVARSRGLLPYALRNWVEELGLNRDYPLLRMPVRDLMGKSGVQAWKGQHEWPKLTVNQNAEPATILTFTLPPKSVCVHPGPASAVAVSWTSPIAGKVRVTGRVADADPAAGDGITWRLSLHNQAGRQQLGVGILPNAGAEPLPAEPLKALEVGVGDRLELLVHPNAEYTCDTTALTLNVAAVDGSGVWDLAGDLMNEPLKGNPHADHQGRPDVWRFEDHDESSIRGRLAVEAAPAFANWRKTVTDSPEDSKAIERAASQLQSSFQPTDHRSPFWIQAVGDEAILSEVSRQKIQKARSELTSLRANPPTEITYANGAQEGGVPDSPQAGFHDVKVHIRGSYSRLGEIVPRHFPIVLGGEPKAKIAGGSGRLELARWLTRPDHVLTSRVMVNRIWQHHMGAGIVRTPSNFGKLGEKPSHPELLDFLARTFVESGWSIKQMHRTIMLSSAYRQASEPDPETLKADPDNRLFARMNRRRLESEAIRDNLLAVSGQLDPTLGGPSLRDLTNLRRTLYLTTVRSDRSSFGPLFDAADSTALVDTRTVSTVAPQALFLMNSPYVLEQSKALAKRLIAQEPDRDRRIERAYAMLFGRPPGEAERQIGRDYLASIPGDEDAWVAYCQTLICTNEFIYID
ncbi:PSD1 and planctomycete cytochrome C domain-containing protein [Singulisphaera sp. PoT]|uniref:PSD1 and planctomycete cytochrome C domain-containing protein n=1 Tax=Singulisphaera sp. PoT TaxID=3411797 RepID=UPI003BF5D4CF